ncbi:MAG: nuclear transport factor 2 family protein [Pseudoxanthomonas sp.]
MTPLLQFARALSLAVLAWPAAAAEKTDADAATEVRCAVWMLELDFARSVATHDAAAFAGFVHADAVFSTATRPMRGRDAVMAEWAPVIDGSTVEVRWYPDKVEVGGDGHIAYSSGPALYRTAKDGRHWLSRYGSVWQRGDDGQWKVVFDEGVAAPTRTNAAGVAAFEAGRRETCPSA